MALLFTFRTVSAALVFESFLKDWEIACQLVPPPSQLGDSCVYAALIDSEPESWAGLIETLELSGVAYDKAYCRSPSAGEDIYTTLDAAITTEEE
ncbi:MAG: DUF3343 domain-containing protein [Synergistaceae bacterium]|nr:DUF3343 domain-containing protein [Synergistaceae bacterium]